MPEEVRRAREEDERASDANQRILAPLIDAHLTAYAAALDELDGAHRLVADGTHLQLDAETRQAAMWLVTGRCIGLARASHELAATGYVFETVPVLRSLHEASRLLTLVTLRGEDDVVQRWLDGRHVPRGEIMAAINRQEEATRAEMIQAGIAPPSTTRAYMERQYGGWSEVAHHRRRHMLTQVSVSARIMVTGPHPDWRARAMMVDHYGWELIGLVSGGGSALARLLGASWFHDRFQPTRSALYELKERVPLSEIARGEQPSPDPGP
jgi:hypothetical protein